MQLLTRAAIGRDEATAAMSQGKVDCDKWKAVRTEIDSTQNTSSGATEPFRMQSATQQLRDLDTVATACTRVLT